jgi:hypothetical protein
MFSWERAAAETITVYRHAVAGTLRAAAPAPAALRTGASR